MLTGSGLMDVAADRISNDCNFIEFKSNKEKKRSGRKRREGKSVGWRSWEPRWAQ